MNFAASAVPEVVRVPERPRSGGIHAKQRGGRRRDEATAAEHVQVRFGRRRAGPVQPMSRCRRSSTSCFLSFPWTYYRPRSRNCY